MVRFQAETATPPESIRPRACDCDFCSKHAAAWVSDSGGTLHIHVTDERKLGRYRQSPDGLAEFVVCTDCGVLVAVVHQTYGAFNSRAAEGVGFGSPVVVSPKNLLPEQRLERWQDVWFRSVTLKVAP